MMHLHFVSSPQISLWTTQTPPQVAFAVGSYSCFVSLSFKKEISLKYTLRSGSTLSWNIFGRKIKSRFRFIFEHLFECLKKRYKLAYFIWKSELENKGNILLFITYSDIIVHILFFIGYTINFPSIYSKLQMRACFSSVT